MLESFALVWRIKFPPGLNFACQNPWRFYAKGTKEQMESQAYERNRETSHIEYAVKPFSKERNYD